MTSVGIQRVGAKGQVVIPKEIRDRLGIHAGDHMRFWVDDDHLVGEVTHPSATGVPLLGRFAGSPLTRELERARDSDRIREHRR